MTRSDAGGSRRRGVRARGVDPLGARRRPRHPLGTSARTELLRSDRSRADLVALDACRGLRRPNSLTHRGGGGSDFGSLGCRGTGSGRSLGGHFDAQGEKRLAGSHSAGFWALFGRRGRGRLRRLGFDRVGGFARAVLLGGRLRLGRFLGRRRLLVARRSSFPLIVCGGSHNPDLDSYRLLGSRGRSRSGIGCAVTAIGRLLVGRRLRSIADFRRVFACSGRRLCARDLVAGRGRLLAHR